MVNNNCFEFIAELWKKDKKQYVKLSTYSAYCLLVDNHLIPEFKGKEDITEDLVQKFVLKKLTNGLNEKTIKDILIVLKMILKFGVKNQMIPYRQIDIKFPTNHDKKIVDVLTRDNQRKLMEYLNENFTLAVFPNFNPSGIKSIKMLDFIVCSLIKLALGYSKE